MIPLCGTKKNMKEKRLVDKVLKSNKVTFDKNAEKFIDSMNDQRTNRILLDYLQKRTFQLVSKTSILSWNIMNIINLMDRLIVHSISHHFINYCLDISTVIIEYMIKNNPNLSDINDLKLLLIQTLTKIFHIDEEYNNPQREYLSVVQFICIESKFPLSDTKTALRKESLKCLHALCSKLFEEVRYVEANVIIVSIETCIYCIYESTLQVSKKLVNYMNECLKLAQAIVTRIIKFMDYTTLEVSKYVLDHLFGNSNFVSNTVFFEQFIFFTLNYMMPQHKCNLLTSFPKYVENYKFSSVDQKMEFIEIYTKALKRCAPFENTKHQLSITITTISFFINLINKSLTADVPKSKENAPKANNNNAEPANELQPYPMTIKKVDSCFQAILKANNIVSLERTILQLWDSILEESRSQRNLQNTIVSYTCLLTATLIYERPRAYFETLHSPYISNITSALSLPDLKSGDAQLLLQYLLKRLNGSNICPTNFCISDVNEVDVEKSLKKFRLKSKDFHKEKIKISSHHRKQIVDRLMHLFKVLFTLNSTLENEECSVLLIKIIYLSFLNVSAIEEKVVYIVCFLLRLQAYIIDEKSLSKSSKGNSLMILHQIMIVISIFLKSQKMRDYFLSVTKRLPKFKFLKKDETPNCENWIEYDLNEIKEYINETTNGDLKIRIFPKFKDILRNSKDNKSGNTSIQVSFHNTIDSNGWISRKGLEKSIDSMPIDEVNSNVWDSDDDNNNNENETLMFANNLGAATMTPAAVKDATLNTKAIFQEVQETVEFKDNADLLQDLKAMTLA